MINSIISRHGINGTTDLDNFVVNNAVAKSTIVQGLDLKLYPSDQAPLAYAFEAYDGVLIKSVYIRLPYQFTLADGGYQFFLNYNQVSVGDQTIPQLGEGINNEGLNITMENIEIEINTYIPPPTGGVGPWWFTGGINILGGIVAPAVSQVNSPVILNGVTLPIYFGLKIVHAYPMRTLS